MRVAKNNQKTDERRAAILVEARVLFLDSGSAGFSMRNLAKKIDMSLSHLQYFFPTKDQLFLEMVRHTVNDYLINYKLIMKESYNSPEQQMSAVLDYLFRDLMRLEVTAIFVELWGMALRDVEARLFQRKLYRVNRRKFSAILARVYPDASRETIKRVATQVLVHIDGIMVLYMVDWPSAQNYERIVQDAKFVIWGAIASLAMETNVNQGS
ncbi:HTH-type transcriptional regulator BetI [Pseudomonas sp. Bi70]|uniref:TetR/AcrR family transcriptional regulator n=1 Tax=Pseudomonas sp. Bi70 TaxID=2821127 RepID=UPI001DA45639|nr:TetR family transcriptional regulator C-terminal domain-containing protein [Pseudomonas sp. Bi70]CAH0144240.1 HTH-type transcriptional regulator BetI [Pseudomonas sp. Bi70]